MKHDEPERKVMRAVSPPSIVRAFRELYILSGAAAQFGGYGLEVLDSQWDALIRCTRGARAVAGREGTCDAEAVTAFGQLLVMCEYVVDLRMSGRPCPPALWREVARMGRDAYPSIDRDAAARREGGI